MAKSKKIEVDAAKLYNSGLAIDDVAEELGVCYRTARKAIRSSGVVLRDPSARLILRAPAGRSAGPPDAHSRSDARHRRFSGSGDWAIEGRWGSVLHDGVCYCFTGGCFVSESSTSGRNDCHRLGR